MAEKKTGILIYDLQLGRYDIRFGWNDYFGGLHCGNCFDVLVNDEWLPTRLEYWDDRWFLVNVKTERLDGLQVRI